MLTLIGTLTGIMMLKVATVIGTRPEIIRMSTTIKKLDALDWVDHTMIHANQNNSKQLKDVFFEDLALRNPDRELRLKSAQPYAFLDGLFEGTRLLLEEVQPDAVLVLGDTNSALSLLVAQKMGIPTFHLEAGNRSFDRRVPEELNRKILDHVADFNLTYTEFGRRNLEREGIAPENICVTGSPLAELLESSSAQISASDIHERLGLTKNEYFVASIHRNETVTDELEIKSLAESLRAVVREWGIPIIVSTHPRAKDSLQNRFANEDQDPQIIFHPPFGLWDYLRLQTDAMCVLSDSGSVTEEAAILGFNAVTLRRKIERPEGIESAVLPAVGVTPDRVLRGIRLASHSEVGDFHHPYSVTNFSDRVLNFVHSKI